jgi:hypothetical protein
MSIIIVISGAKSLFLCRVNMSIVFFLFVKDSPEILHQVMYGLPKKSQILFQRQLSILAGVIFI